MHFSGWHRVFIVISAIWFAVCINYGYSNYPEVNYKEKWANAEAINKEADEEIRRISCEGYDRNLTEDEVLPYLKCANETNQTYVTQQINKERKERLSELDLWYATEQTQLPRRRMIFIGEVALVGLLTPVLIYFMIMWVVRGFQAPAR